MQATGNDNGWPWFLGSMFVGRVCAKLKGGDVSAFVRLANVDYLHMRRKEGLHQLHPWCNNGQRLIILKKDICVFSGGRDLLIG